MSAMTDYLEVELLDHVFRNAAYASPTTVYCSLHTTATTDAGGGTEVSGGSYAREAVTFGAPSSPGGTMSNSVAIDFGTATANWGTITHAAIQDAISAGNMLVHGPLTASKTVNNGDGFQFPIGNFDITAA